ncbi:MAG: histidyl-tRNA synthetase [Rickettsiales bacterium]|jgi:histidyl-tRNA synthetase
MKNQISKEKLQPVRGTKDLYGKEIQSFNHIIETAKKSVELYGFNEISTPIFEFSEIFERNLGETSDIISKEVYKFPDRGDNFLTLRPEFTAGVIRALISNGELAQTLPQKLFSSGPVFRYDRPQKGRQRQFHQINFESIGQDHFLSDSEMIVLAARILKDLKILKKTQLHVNTLGSEKTKENYQAALIEYFSKYEKDLSNDSQKRLQKNPLRILDSKDAGDIKISMNAPSIQDFLSVDEGEAFRKALTLLNELGIEYYINPKLVRGLDYYTGIVFEFVTNDLGTQNTVLAGGRYDNLVAQMGGQNLPAIGFAAGIERLMLLSEFENEAKRPIFVVYVTEKEEIEATKLAFRLREKGMYAEITFGGNMKKQMKKATLANSKFVVIIGEDEVKNKELTVKNFDTGSEEKVANKNIIKYLKSGLEEGE